ncbi:MAG: hypothetical protein ACYCPT_06655 [Acidimicrobiales bacterium]
MKCTDAIRSAVITSSARASWWIALSQWNFAFFIALCVALHPGFVLKANEGGMSNYGVHLKTVLPYTLAMALTTGLTLRGASLLTSPSLLVRRFKVLIRTYSVLIGFTLLSTYGYTLNEPLKITHIVIGVAIMTFQTLASLWMVRIFHASRVVLAAQLIGYTLAALTFFGALHVLFLSQVITGVAFAFLVVQTARTLPSDTINGAPSPRPTKNGN